MKTELIKKQHDALMQSETTPVASRPRAYTVRCAIKAGDMEASVRIDAPARDCGLTEHDIIASMFQQGIRAGVHIDLIADIVARERIGEEIVVAAGFQPEHGKDAEFVKLVQLEEFPASEESAGVPVELDQPIIEKRPATAGRPGLTVRGEPIEPVPGKDIAFNPGENTVVSNDGLNLIAAKPGLAGFFNGLPTVREPGRDEWKFKIKVRKEKMEAVLIIVPGETSKPDITDEFIGKLLESNNIGFGVIPEVSRLIPPEISMTTVIKVADGKPPSAGKDAKIIERFRDATAKGQNLFPVKNGTLLVEKVPAQPGAEGRNVHNEIIKPPDGKDAEMEAGVNTHISDDRLKIYAGIDGYVSRQKNAYCVVECMEINAGAGAFPQRINYEGMLRIRGNVTESHVITAGHHVVIEGDITASEVIAGGFLQVTGCISECTNTRIQAAGDMYLGSASRARLRAGGNVYFSGKATDCEIVSNGGVYNTEQDSFSLAGGKTIAARNVEADEIGAGKADTIIEVGVPFQVRARFDQSASELALFNRKLKAVSQEINRLAALAKSKNITREEFDEMRRLVALYKAMPEKISLLKAATAKLLPIINSLSEGSNVMARNFLHQGTSLKIGIHSFRAEKEHGGSLFKTDKDNKAIVRQEIKSQVKKEATIMFTDIVGYSTYTSLHGDMMASTMLQKHNDLLFPLVGSNSGRIIKTIGDSIMAIFGEPDNALRSAIMMQRALEEHNESEREEHKIKIRIGLNTGIGIIEGDDVFGDVVNMAARVEALTDADEIKISRSTFAALTDKSMAGFRSLGMKKLKGKEELVEIFDVIWEE